jgi:membrane protease subunit HflC
MKNLVRGLAALAVLLVLTPFWIFVIDKREQAVVLRFGAPVREFHDPGVHFKVPFVETVVLLPSTVQMWHGSSITDLPTSDDKKIDVEPWSLWRINDPTAFVQRLRTMSSAEQRVAQITRSTVRDLVTQYELAELVRSTNRMLSETDSTISIPEEAGEIIKEAAVRSQVSPIEVGRAKLLANIRAEAVRRSEAGGGIELIDVGISQVDFVSVVREKTFDRWIEERRAISALIENVGKKESQEIVNKAKAQAERIIGEGQRQASEKRGTADANVISRYAETIDQVGDFYTFVRTLEAYEVSITSETRMIMTTDSDFLRLLKEGASMPAAGEE